jgi:hypothetical protein
VICPNVSSKQGPPAARTNLLQAPQYQFPARRIQDVGLLAHSVSCSLFLAGVSLWQRGGICILSHRNGSSLAREPSSVANKCNEVSRRFRRSLTVAVLYWKSHRNMSTRYARKLSFLLTRSGVPIFMSHTHSSVDTPSPDQRLSIIKVRVRKPNNSLHVHRTEECRWRREKTPRP